MAEPTKTQPISNDKLTLILVIVFGSISVLLLAYIALRVTVGPRHQLKGQIQQQRGLRLNPQSIDQPRLDPMTFDEEMNLN